MFVSWVTSAKVDGGFSSIADVTKKDHTFSDNMESFVFAETFKCVQHPQHVVKSFWRDFMSRVSVLMCVQISFLVTVGT